MRHYHSAEATYLCFYRLWKHRLDSALKRLNFARVKGSSNYRASNLIFPGEHEKR